MTIGSDYVDFFNRDIRAFFGNALRVSLKNPTMALFALRTILWQNRAARVRLAWERRGIHVPPMMIASITQACNLKCVGCYARAHHRASSTEMSADKLRSVFAEAVELGVSIIMIAGGEPLTRPEILDVTHDFPTIIFPLFTNGILLSDQVVHRLKAQRNVVPVISLEGREKETDDRRGRGVYAYLMNAMERMREEGIFFGASITLTRKNFSIATETQFVRGLIARGCKLFFFLDYVPIEGGTEDLVLTNEQRDTEARTLASFRAELPALFIAFPGDEEMYGGCLAAGRGFVHMSPEGNLEPCPASPYSDSSLTDLPLREALQSQFLRTIRETEGQLAESKGGCALWEKREWVRSLLPSD